jgi:hypothetical protein
VANEFRNEAKAIGNKLQVSNVIVHRDLVHLNKQAQENLQRHIHETVPAEYQKCMCTMKDNLKHVLEIGESVTDPRVKLEARRIANDILRHIIAFNYKCWNSIRCFEIRHSKARTDRYIEKAR